MITTKKIQLTASSYFKILLSIYLRKRWWFLIIIWLMAVMMISKDQKDSFEISYIFFAIFYPISLVVRYWIYANSKDNKLFLLERYFEIYEGRIVGFLNDGTESTIKIEHFIKVIELKSIYLLYVAKNQFIFITKDSFKSDADRIWFETKILSNIQQ